MMRYIKKVNKSFLKTQIIVLFIFVCKLITIEIQQHPSAEALIEYLHSPKKQQYKTQKMFI